MNYIFDFDGTLMDTSAVIMATIKATIKEMGLPPKTDEECRSIIGIRTDEAGRYLYPNINISNKEFARVFRSNYNLLKKDVHEKTFPGVISTLSKLRESGCGLAIASSRRSASLSDYLDSLGIRSWFEIVVGADSVTNGKPNPEPVLTILKALNWNAEDTLVVGDADVDIMMGNAAGCKTCAVTYGNGSIPSLKAARPNYMIDTFPELESIR
ncbi:MAG: HAD family hydrolase [Muribaculum sp.]|nr:HAD family hydrolase [Muribaculaceae bacterium]MCM1081789.1 HAD family hydrolase [Muribaculum sp.]